MARAIFSHELADPDFQWLLSNYAEQKRLTAMVDVPCLPVVLVVLTPEESEVVSAQPSMPVPPPTGHAQGEGIEEPSSE